MKIEGKEMNKIVCFISRDKFTDGFISFFEKYFEKKYEFVFFTIKDDNFPLSKHVFPIYEIVKFMDLFTTNAYRYVEEADVFIVSGLFIHINRGYKFNQNILDKLWIDFWGGDYTCFRKRYIWRNPLAYIRICRRMQLIRKCRGWILEMKEDYAEIKKHSGVDKLALVAPILSPRDVEEKQLYVTKIRKPDDTVNILLGNSAAPENCHIKILKELSHLKTENIKIVCPLSYGGNKNYVRKVIRIAKKLYGDKFYPLLTFLPKEEYFKLFQDIDVAIFNNNRQQGMGNIEEMLRQGKKVYLRVSTPMWNWYKEKGYEIFDIKDLNKISFDCFKDFALENATKNVEIDMAYRKNKIAVQLWQDVFDTALGKIKEQG